METNELTELITKLKRYSFESKMEKCQKYSEEHLDFLLLIYQMIWIKFLCLGN